MYKSAREKKEGLQLKIFFLLGVVAALLIIGMFFYHWVEGWSLLDSLYFSAISLMSRGFSEMYPSKWFSVLFSIFYLLIGAAIMIYTISTLVAFYTNYYQEKMHMQVQKIGNMFKKEKPRKEKWVVLTEKKQR